MDRKPHMPISKKKQDIFVLSVILLVTILVFSNSISNGFVNLDDDEYILNSPYMGDLSFNGIKKIFDLNSFYSGNYHPLTTLSWAIQRELSVKDVQKYGPGYYLSGDKAITPKTFHTVNLLLHLLNVILVYILVGQLTGRIEASVIAALFFAIHPMHVESVSWISEHKDVLYTFFYLAALIAYVQYIKKTKPLFLIMSLLLFVLSLLSKSAAVTLPVVMLLMDYYAARRFSLRLIMEKVVFFGLSVIFGVLALKSQAVGGAIGDIASTYSFIDRIFLVSYSIVFYLVRLFAPLNLSAMHYYPADTGAGLPWYFYGSLIIVMTIPFLVSRARDLRKDLIFGLLFFLITISLVLQVIAVGNAIVAERYTYVPYIGLFLIIGRLYCRVADNRARFAAKIKLCFLFALCVYAVLSGILTFSRNNVWKDTVTLATDMIDKDSSWFFGHHLRGSAKKEMGDFNGALEDLDKAIEISAKSGREIDRVYSTRGEVKRQLQDYKGAISDYSRAIELNPKNPIAYNNRGNAKAVMEEYKEAVLDFSKAIEIDPKAYSYINRANALLMMADYQGAVSDYSRAIELDPAHNVAFFNRAFAKFQLNDRNGACQDWRQSSRLGNAKAGEMLEKTCL